MNSIFKRKVPYIEQLQQTECGLCCVAMILRYYNSYETLNELREYVEAGRDGLRLTQIKNLLENLNFSVKAYKAGIEGLKKVGLPAIIYWNNEHYVVLEKIKDNKIHIVDPAFGRKKMSEAEFTSHFSNYVLVCTPNDNFEPKKKNANPWLMILPSIYQKKDLLVKAIIFSLITYIITLAVPMITQYLIDEIVQKNRYDKMGSFIAIVIVLFTLFAFVMFMRGRSLIRLQVNLDKKIMGNTFLHLLKIPYKFFEVRQSGDLLFRLNSLQVVRDLISEQIIKGIIDLGAIIFILVYMCNKSLFLTCIAVVIFILNGLFIILTRPHILEANQNEINENTKMQNVQVEALYSIFGIKLSGMEENIYDNWKGKLNNYLVANRKKESIQNIYGTANNVIQMIAPVIVFMIGIYQFYHMKITIGEVIAFQSLSGTFFDLSVSIFNTYNNYILANSYLERVRDITETEIEKTPDNPITTPIKGNIKLENVCFSYTKHSSEVIKNINIDIKEGQKIAFVGASGSGKSTLGKILLGIYMPTAGNIYYDDQDLELYDKQILRRQMGIVPQDISLFNKSILENIRMNNFNAEIDEVKRAAEIAQISEEIESMPMGYNTLVSESGMNLSGGQRQRIALARALINNPRIIILDEATSSLDSINEKKISEYFSEIGCTQIVIAHRLSTIIDSDMIYVLDKGEIVESGTHEELVNLGGVYCKLYNGQID